MISLMLSTFENTVKFIEQSVSDLSEKEMIEQPMGVPNHATWTLGHVVHSCQGIANELGARAWLPNTWELTFGYGSTPVADQSRYPSKAEMLKNLSDANNRLRQVLSGISESSLTQSVPNEALPTMGHFLFQVLIAHTAFHAGQLALWRHALGKQPLAVFV